MGIMSKIISGGGQHSTDEYLDLDIEGIESSRGEAGMSVRIATISGQQDVIAIKDAVYDGDLVIADITRHTTSDSTMEHIVDDLRQVAQEVDGDIAQKGDDQIIISPTGVGVAREKLN
ncbi:cell division protein SepF [Halobellus captivus]|uniref:cell division protein SepF n=1 Tax=Halobellus captivus TaxID=2592614 RepID=UPI0011AAB2A1|nr:cell division protein SepF [Halobellus captivus]